MCKCNTAMDFHGQTPSLTLEHMFCIMKMMFSNTSFAVSARPQLRRFSSERRGDPGGRPATAHFADSKNVTYVLDHLPCAIRDMRSATCRAPHNLKEGIRTSFESFARFRSSPPLLAFGHLPPRPCPARGSRTHAAIRGGPTALAGTRPRRRRQDAPSPPGGYPPAATGPR